LYEKGSRFVRLCEDKVIVQGKEATRSKEEALEEVLDSGSIIAKREAI